MITRLNHGFEVRQRRCGKICRFGNHPQRVGKGTDGAVSHCTSHRARRRVDLARGDTFSFGKPKCVTDGHGSTSRRQPSEPRRAISDRRSRARNLGTWTQRGAFCHRLGEGVNPPKAPRRPAAAVAAEAAAQSHGDGQATPVSAIAHQNTSRSDSS